MSETSEVLKAYENLEFLHSPPARAIRVLCELTEPEQRFRRFGIRNTIVFFGATRSMPRDKAERNLAELEAQRGGGGGYEQELRKAKAKLGMSRYYEAARELSYRLTEWSGAIEEAERRFYICSGGGHGIMEAANRGAAEAGGKSIGLNISLPEAQERNAYQTPELSFDFHYFFIRKFWFFYLAKALVIFPGGFGTLDELFELLTLVQTQKSKKYMPIIIYGSDYWKEVLNFESLVKTGTVDAEDVGLFRFFDEVEGAFEYLKKELTEHYL